MRFTNTIAALAAVMLSSYPHAHADSDKADQSVIADEALPPSPAPPAIVLPNFSPSTVATGFFEQFTSGWDKRWKPSHAKKVASGDEEWAYVGKWAVEEPTVYPGIVGDKGLVVKKAAAHHAISAKFPKKIDLKGQTLVVQYEVKLQNGLECGGAYLKLLRDQKTLHSEEFSNTTPYVIMFGPDKCGLTNKVHFIFNHKNPVSGKYEEKHLTTPPSMRPVKTTELYTLIVHPNNTYIIKQNNVQVKNGSLLTDFTPAVNPDKEINDPTDEKPADWVDEAQILDEKAKKPDDWDEEAPSQIDDEEATTPEDWLVDEPKSIPDPEAQKPTDWDDDEDGDWVAPTVPNPKCLEISGCGKWIRPLKANPLYKGKWSAPLIPNPAYKGEWTPRKIKNPDYFEDLKPANFEPLGAIGFEIWTMQNNILFDNIYVGHSVADADRLASETFAVKIRGEKAAEDVDKAKEPPKATSPSDINFWKEPVSWVREHFQLFYEIAQYDLPQAIKFVPQIAAGLAVVVLTGIGLIVSLVAALIPRSVMKEVPAKASAKAKEVSAKAKDASAKVGEVKPKVAEVLAKVQRDDAAAATGAEAKAGVSKRVAKSLQE